MNNNENYADQVEGRNAVRELLNSDKDINKIFIQKGDRHGSILEIIAKAKEKRILINEVDKFKLDQMAQSDNHQGVIAMVPPYEYSSVDEILEYAKEKNEDPFILILDEIEDPHNLGSIIRTAECCGVHGIIIPKRRACPVNSTVNKTSVGAAQYVKVARVNNLNDTIKELKENDVWIYGTDMNGSVAYNKQNYKGGVGLVIGNEGSGMGRLVRKL